MSHVLLNLYRYSPETTEQFLDLIGQLADRIWLPHQAGYEYQKNRLGEISRQEKSYDELIAFLNETKEKTKMELEERLLSKRHPFLKDAETLIEKFGKIFEDITSRLEKMRDEYVIRNDQDNIRDKITSLFEEKVGSAYSEEELEEIYREGKKRYENKIPPGYMDSNEKSEPEMYGDLVLWHQVIDKAKSDKKAIILIVDEKKEDWWLKSRGKIIIHAQNS